MHYKHVRAYQALGRKERIAKGGGYVTILIDRIATVRVVIARIATVNSNGEDGG